MYEGASDGGGRFGTSLTTDAGWFKGRDVVEEWYDLNEGDVLR